MKPIALASLSPDVATHCAPLSLVGKSRSQRRTPAQILARNLGRTPLRCDGGPVRQDLGRTQEHAHGARAARV